MWRCPNCRAVALLAGLLLALTLTACGRVATSAGPGGATVADGNVGRGEQAIVKYGCGSCHIIPGVGNARGLIGPPLLKFSRRGYIAGEITNTPDNLVFWIMQPQAVEPGTVMPNMGVTDSDARDIAAYLYTLK